MNPLRAIIIDDVKLIRAEFKMLLQEVSEIHIVGEAANGEEAVKLITELNPDVVFLDIHLPDFSGFELLNKVKMDFKVVFITSYFNKYSHKARQFAPVAFLMKPINKDQLFEVVNQLIMQNRQNPSYSN